MRGGLFLATCSYSSDLLQRCFKSKMVTDNNLKVLIHGQRGTSSFTSKKQNQNVFSPTFLTGNGKATLAVLS